MRHRSQSTENHTPRTTLHGVTGTLESLTELLAAQDVTDSGGKHRGLQLIPSQTLPGHDTGAARIDTPIDTLINTLAAPKAAAPSPIAPVAIPPVVLPPVAAVPTTTELTTELTTALTTPLPVTPLPQPVREVPTQRLPFEITTRFDPASFAPVPFDPASFESLDDDEADELPSGAVPHVASWKASHLPRVLAGLLFAGSAAGTAALAVRLVEGRQVDDVVALVTGLAVSVVLWAVMIASTPQVVSLNGSILTIHNSGGDERFDLADSLQPVDVVDHPRSSQWAVLLHRSDRTSVVLRHADVKAAEFDPIVRHYRRIADRTYAEREARFNR